MANDSHTTGTAGRDRRKPIERYVASARAAALSGHERRRRPARCRDRRRRYRSDPSRTTGILADARPLSRHRTRGRQTGPVRDARVRGNVRAASEPAVTLPDGSALTMMRPILRRDLLEAALRL